MLHIYQIYQYILQYIQIYIKYTSYINIYFNTDYIEDRVLAFETMRSSFPVFLPSSVGMGTCSLTVIHLQGGRQAYWQWLIKSLKKLALVP